MRYGENRTAVPVMEAEDGEGTAVSSCAKPTLTRLVPGGNSAKKSSGKTPPPISGKSSGKPEVESSGKNDLPLPPKFLPLTPDDDLDVEFDEDIEQESGWRLEENSNGYYRWRWQLKNPDGSPVTYVNDSGNIGYKRGSKYVGKKTN